MRSRLSAKAIPLEMESLRTKTCLFLERTDFSWQFLREHVGNGIVFHWNKVDIKVALFNIIKPLNDAVRSGLVSGNVEVVGMDMQHSS